MNWTVEGLLVAGLTIVGSVVVPILWKKINDCEADRLDLWRMISRLASAGGSCTSPECPIKTDGDSVQEICNSKIEKMERKNGNGK